jgi:ribose-phosphate pyrophosphokinase
VKTLVVAPDLDRRMLVLGFPEYAEQGLALARAADAAYAEVEIHRFPDGETLVRLPPGLPPRVVLCRSLDRPNDKILELCMTARTARELGAKEVGLVAPYLCYMRQDKAFVPGEAVSQRIVGALLADWFDSLVTVDPHLHRVHRLADAVPAVRTESLTAASIMGQFLADKIGSPLLLGPDAESEQWVKAIAAPHRFDYRVGVKQRRGDRDVHVDFPGLWCRGRHCVLVDDVASTGRTLEAAAVALAAQRPASVAVLVTHALFLEGSLDRLRALGVEQVWSTDSIPHPTNRLALGPLLAAALVHSV